MTVKKYTKKRDSRAKLLFCLVKLLLFLLSRRHFIFKLPIIYDTLSSVRNNSLSANLITPADSIRNVFRLIGSSLVSDCGEIIAVVYELTKRTQEKLFADWAQ